MTKKSRNRDTATSATRPYKAPQTGTRAPKAPGARDTARAKANATAGRTRPGSKQAKMIEMLRRPDGATVEEIATAFQWQLHTVRGAIAGALKKKLGLPVTKENVEGRGRVYRIGS
jgi:hypothetical protein